MIASLRRLTLAVALLALPVASAAAQRPPAPGAAARPAMQRLSALVARRLKLSPEQTERLQATTRRFAAEREQVVGQERAARRAIRAQLAAGDAADQQVVGRQLDALLRAQQRRSQLLADEQRELSAFLTPVQRAEYIGMQERAQRAAQQIRQRRAVERPVPRD